MRELHAAIHALRHRASARTGPLAHARAVLDHLELIRARSRARGAGHLRVTVAVWGQGKRKVDEEEVVGVRAAAPQRGRRGLLRACSGGDEVRVRVRARWRL